MKPAEAFEAFARGMMAAVLAAAETAPPAPKRKRRRKTAPDSPTLFEAARTTTPAGEPIAPGANGYMPPVITQADLERMERELRGEVPPDRYVPGEGVAPWMER